MQKSIKEVLDTYIEHISSLDEVKQIYLFGSHAYGEPHERSDIDLMVLIDDNLDTRKVSLKISKDLAGKSIIPLDVLVNPKTAFYTAAGEPTIQRQIKNEGVLLYDTN